VGRPSKLTPETQERICSAVRAGNYFEAAAAYAGVTYSSLRSWLKRGKRSRRGKFFEFFKAVEKAQADAEATVVAQWRQQIPENWQAARDFLARRFPGRWGPKERHEVSGPKGGPVPLALEDNVAADRELEEWGREQAGRPGERNGQPEKAGPP
jgi:CubicO group peptidase (beta-lactamase class C family)